MASGRMIYPDGTISKHWDSDYTLVPLCLALRQHPSGRAVQEVAKAEDSASLAFKPGDTAIFLGLSDLGSPAKVLPMGGAGLDAQGKPLAAAGAPATGHVYATWQLLQAQQCAAMQNATFLVC